MYTVITSKCNDREIKFNVEPDKTTLRALKNLKMRWDPIYNVWYGLASEEEILNTIKGGYKINDYKVWYTRRELKKFIISDLKKIGIDASIKIDRHKALNITITAPQEWIRPEEEYIKNFDVYYCGNIYDINGYRIDIYDYIRLSDKEQEEIRKATAKEYYYSKMNCLQINSNDIIDYISFIYTEECKQKLNEIIKIILSYNCDEPDNTTEHFEIAQYEIKLELKQENNEENKPKRGENRYYGDYPQ